jgi:acetylornithine deacetylase/succinyl-diaminopimelate desuccinylase-like protein
MLFATALNHDSMTENFADPARLPVWQTLGARWWRPPSPAASRPAASAASTRWPSPGRPDADAARAVAWLRDYTAVGAKTHSGVWRDLAVRKRRTEAEAQIGIVPRLAAEHGVATPRPLGSRPPDRGDRGRTPRAIRRDLRRPAGRAAVTDPVLARLLGDRAGFVARLAELVACPSVSTDPAYAAGMVAARAWWRRRLAAMGFRDVAEIAEGGHPAVVARWHGAGPDAPTLLVYGHYDVQPPDPDAAWLSPPFVLTARDGRLYARGVSDNKGPSLLAVEALGAVLAVEGALPFNLTVLLEGEEEVGSATLAKILASRPDLFTARCRALRDGARWRADMPTMTTGTRGLAALEVSLRTAAKDLHSGRYGGVAPNATHTMARLLATLHDAAGDIAVAGFLDGVPAVTDAQREELARIPFDVAAHDASIGMAPSGRTPAEFLERLWLQPTLDVNGMSGGYTGIGGKTVIPAEAHAKLSMRLVRVSSRRRRRPPSPRISARIARRARR